MSDSSARGMVREWQQGIKMHKSYSTELSAKLDELEQLVATWHRIADQCQKAGDVSPVAIIKADIVRKRAMEIEAWLGKKEGQ